MEKDNLKKLLIEILRKHSTLFTDISIKDELDTIFVTSAEGRRFSIVVNSLTENETLIHLWAKKNPKLMSLTLEVLNMRDLGIFTEEETDRYLSKIVAKADNSCAKGLNGKSGSLSSNL